LIRIYRRHLKSCPHTSENDRRCRCPIWAEGSLGDERVRRSLNLTSWEAAQRWVRDREIAGTATHKTVPHVEVVNALVETLGFRHIAPVREEYAVSRDGMKLFGIMELETTFEGCRFAIGIRNAHDKSMRLAMTAGYRVFICDNMAFSGDFTPVLAKHSKNFNLTHALEIGVSDMQRNFDGMVRQVDRWRDSRLTDVSARMIIYQAFIEAETDFPKHLARPIHDLYFNPQHEEFGPRTMWSLSNAFTSAFKQLDPVPQFRATAQLGPFLEARIL
jgi:Domain of unknown function (DUF932)